MIKPPIIYLGNKYRFLPTILPLIHPNRTLIEPFVGSGAVFLNSRNQNVIINDLNKDIINLHKHLRFYFPELIKEVTKICNKEHDSAEEYYKLRTEFNETDASIRKTAIFLYMNYCGFKGLCRYARGKFNVPYHRGYAASAYSFKKLHDAHQVLKTKELTCFSSDFREVLKPCGNATVFLDPPYLPSEGKTHCEAYLGKSFGLSDHQDIVTLAEEYRKLGSTAIICNHLTNVTRDLYKNADQLIELSRKTGVQHNSKMEVQKECLVVYGRAYTEKCKLF